MNSTRPPNAPPPPEHPDDSTNGDPIQTLRLAWSYDEFARHQLRECEEARTANRIDAERYVSVHGFYEGHLRRAQQQLDSARTDVRKRLGRIQALVTSVESRQADLANQVRQGGLTPEEANELNRGLQLESSDLRRQAIVTRQALEAENAEALGGFIHLSLDEYAATHPPHRAAGKPARKKSNVGFAVAAAVVVIVTGLALSVLGVLPTPDGVSASVGTDGPRVNVSVSNDGAGAIRLFVPWPDGTGRTTPDDDQVEPAYGITLHVLEKRFEEFRLLPVSEGCWSFQGSTIMGFGPVLIHPGLDATVTLNSAKLEEIGIDATAVKLIVSRAGGGKIQEQDVKLPKDPS